MMSAVAKGGQPLTRKSHGVFVPVKAAQFDVAGGAEHYRGMAAHPQGAVQITAPARGERASSVSAGSTGTCRTDSAMLSKISVMVRPID